MVTCCWSFACWLDILYGTFFVGGGRREEGMGGEGREGRRCSCKASVAPADGAPDAPSRLCRDSGGSNVKFYIILLVR